MKIFGLEINLSKSVISNNGSFEFAKVSSYKGHTVSPISWKMFMSQRSLIGRVNIAHHLITTIRPKRIVSYFKNITRYRPKKGRKLCFLYY